MFKAYLCIRFVNDGTPFPKMKDADIFSSPAQSLSHQFGEFYVDVTFASSKDSYQEAKDRLIAWITQIDEFKWARIWVAEGINAHMMRGILTGAIPATEKGF